MKLSVLFESGPAIKTLKDNEEPLTDEERSKVMKAKATWPFGKNGAASPAVKKSAIRGKIYYWSTTHRCYQAAPTLKQAIKDFHETVEPSR